MKKLIVILSLLLALACVLVACDSARSITKSEIVNGELVITYSDGTSENLGKVVGDDGEKGEKGDKGDTATDDNPQGLDFYPLSDGTYAVGAGRARYLEEIIIPATYNGKAVTQIAGNGFNGCSLKKITIPNSIIRCGNAAFLNSAVEAVYITDLEAWCRIEFVNNTCGAKNLYLNETLVTDLIIPNTITQIKNNAFSEFTCLESVVIPNSVTSISGDAFARCTSLKTVTISNGVTDIGGSAFSYCRALTSVTIPDSVTSIDNFAFYGCDSLVSAAFETSEGWVVKSQYGPYNEVALPSADLADPAVAARYLSSTYSCDYAWSRVEE